MIYIIFNMDFNKYFKMYEKNKSNYQFNISIFFQLTPIITNILIDYFNNKSIDYKYYFTLGINLVIPPLITEYLKYSTIKSDYFLNLDIPELTIEETLIYRKFKDNLIFLINEGIIKIKKDYTNNNYNTNHYSYYTNANNLPKFNKYLTIGIYYNEIQINNKIIEFILIVEGNNIFKIYCKNSSDLKKVADYITNYSSFKNSFIELKKHMDEIKIIKINNNITNFKNIIISKNHLEQINLKLEQFLCEKYNKKLEFLGLKNNLHILLTGKPGTGKTTLSQSIANKLSRNILFVDKNNPKDFFDNLNIIDKENLVIVFDDIDFWDLMNKHVKNFEGNDVNNIYLMKLMELLNGNILNNSVIIFTSNSTNFNDALFRDGRIHLKLEINGFDDLSYYDKFFNIIYDDKTNQWRDEFSEFELSTLLKKELTLANLSEIAKNNIENKKNFINNLKKNYLKLKK